MRKLLIFGIVGLYIAAFAPPASAVGEAGVPSLIIAPGARANGMGAAFVAVADDATALWWNPGGLAFVNDQSLTLMHSQLVPDLASDVYYEYFGYTHNVKNFGTFGASFIYLTYGESFQTNEVGEILAPFTSWEASGLVSFAIPVRKNIGVGLSMKFIHADYAPAWATLEGQSGAGSTVAAEVGVLWKMPARRLNLGMSISNIGPDIAYIDPEQSDPLPTILRVGAAFTATSDEISNLLITFDIEQSLVWAVHRNIETRRGEIYHLGAEYLYINLLAGRVGYIHDKDGDVKSPTFGLGFIYKDRIRVDYASVPQAEDLERVHRWSIGMTF